MLSPSAKFHRHIAILQQRHQFAGWSMPDNTSTVEDPTKREPFELEKRKFEEEQSIKRDSLETERPNDAFGFFKSPLGLAIIGGLVTILVNSASSYFSTQNTLNVEREKLQADLIKKYLEAPEKKAREDNLKFLAGAGLIPAYGKRIEDYLKSNPDAIPHTPISSDYKTFGDPNILSGTVLDKIAAIRNSLVVVRSRQGAVEWRKCTGVLIDQTTVVTMCFHLRDDPLAVGDDPVERQKRQAGGETRDGGRQRSEGGLEGVERRPIAEPPFVEVAEQDGRHLVPVVDQFDQHEWPHRRIVVRQRLLGHALVRPVEPVGMGQRYIRYRRMSGAHSSISLVRKSSSLFSSARKPRSGSLPLSISR